MITIELPAEHYFLGPAKQSSWALGRLARHNWVKPLRAVKQELVS
jgi:hypothetical protein